MKKKSVFLLIIIVIILIIFSIYKLNIKKNLDNNQNNNIINNVIISETENLGVETKGNEAILIGPEDSGTRSNGL